LHDPFVTTRAASDSVHSRHPFLTKFVSLHLFVYLDFLIV
jgi:hypothetical protein